MEKKRGLTPGDPHRTPILPSDLEGSLRHLDEATFARLLAGVLQEAKRRSISWSNPIEKKIPATSQVDTSSSQKGDSASDSSGLSLRQGQINAIRAAFKAGIKIPTIARQFRLPQSTVRQVVASQHQS
ncbi:hypothetical protein [Bradyrhizobium sp. CCGUVB23]|uniref:hypothetical protein n=1 Tax=Bradyrhizobium sp. CCGUVB23 TaxID=2949630 RepID=UPI0020B3899F|nr:hypothetical protein [Bradyrhizobium sp. CCGUVB23]MCP3468451.1 hypothetical protein [Bradyrhizobium sp. CCGUVB23]